LESKDKNNMNVKITDFGFACYFNPSQGGLTDVLGSPLYMAPEIINEEPYD
jgi:serine/threonine protein kinase